MTEKSFTVDLITDENGDIILPLPPEVCKELNIGVGDDISFEQKEDGTITMKRAEKLKLYAVETISIFRHVYFVKAECADHAKDEVTMNQAYGALSEFQTHISEDISSCREIDDKGMYELIVSTEHPDMTEQQWEEEKHKYDRCINVVDYTD